MVDFIRKNHCYQLGNAGKNQFGMQGLFILGTTSSETEVILDMLDISFNNSPDLIGIVPFLCSTECTGISPEVFFRIYINHASAWWRSTGAVTAAEPIVFASLFIMTPFDFRAYKFISCYTTAELWNSFIFHRKGGIFRTARNTIFMNGIIRIFKPRACIQRNVCSGKMFISTKSIAGKQCFIEEGCIKSSITKESFWID